MTKENRTRIRNLIRKTQADRFKQIQLNKKRAREEIKKRRKYWEKHNQTLENLNI